MRPSRWHDATSPALVSRSRAMPVGGPHRENWPALQSSRFFVVGDTRSRGASSSGAGFRAPARCRSETGAPLFRGGRCAISLRVEQRCRVSRSRAMPVGGPHRENWPALQSPRFVAVGDTRSRCASRSGAGFRAPARCRSETGAPLFRGWRCAISRRVAQRCRVSRSRAMPVGDRRSFAVGDAPSGQLGSPGARGIRKKPS